MVLVALTLAGCSSTLQDQESYGPPPSNYRQMARDYLKRTLLDPYSVRDAEIAAPVVKHSFHLIDPLPGWTICVRYNAKNRMGGYVGLTENVLLVRNNRITVSQNEIAQHSTSGNEHLPRCQFRTVLGIDG